MQSLEISSNAYFYNSPLTDFLKVNKTLKELNVLNMSSIFIDPKLVESMESNFTLCHISSEYTIHGKFKLLVESNIDWSPSIHKSLENELFKSSVLIVMLCLKRIHFKIPKYVLAQIFKKIDRRYHS